MIKLVVLWLVLASLSWAELMPGVVSEACELAGDLGVSGGRSQVSDVDLRRDAMTLEVSNNSYDISCKKTTACEQSPIKQPLTQGSFHEVITYSF